MKDILFFALLFVVFYLVFSSCNKEPIMLKVTTMSPVKGVKDELYLLFHPDLSKKKVGDTIIYNKGNTIAVVDSVISE